MNYDPGLKYELSYEVERRVRSAICADWMSPVWAGPRDRIGARVREVVGDRVRDVIARRVGG